MPNQPNLIPIIIRLNIVKKTTERIIHHFRKLRELSILSNLSFRDFVSLLEVECDSCSSINNWLFFIFVFIFSISSLIQPGLKSFSYHFKVYSSLFFILLVIVLTSTSFSLTCSKNFFEDSKSSFNCFCFCCVSTVIFFM